MPRYRQYHPPTRSIPKVLKNKVSEERPVIGDWPKQVYLEPVTTEAMNAGLLLGTLRFY